MARTSPSLGKGRVFSTMGCGSIPGIRMVSPFLNVVLSLFALAMAVTYSATVMYCDSDRCARATNWAVVSALAANAIVPCGSSWVAGADPGVVAGEFCAAADCSAAEAWICACRAKSTTTATSPSTTRATEEMRRNFLDNIKDSFPGSCRHLNMRPGTLIKMAGVLDLPVAQANP